MVPNSERNSWDMRQPTTYTAICPLCNHDIEFGREWADKEINCPICTGAITLPPTGRPATHVPKTSSNVSKIDDRRGWGIPALRWIALLPGSLAIGLLALIVCNGMLSTRFGDNTGILFLVLGNFAFGYGTVFSATAIAPSHKPHVAIIMAGLGLFLSGLILFGAITRFGTGGLVQLIAANVAAIGTAYYCVRREVEAKRSVDHVL
jgi:hypothetical protein